MAVATDELPITYMPVTNLKVEPSPPGFHLVSTCACASRSAEVPPNPTSFPAGGNWNATYTPTGPP